VNVLGWIVLYLVGSLALAVFLGRAIKRANPCRHKWEAKGYGGAGWTLIVCTRCGAREIEPS
jgi:hypothetical protein